MRKRLILTATCVAMVTSIAAQQRLDPNIDAKIRAEGNEHSQINADAPLPDRRLWSADDGIAQLQGRRRMGHQDDGVVGVQQRPPRAWDWGHPGWANGTLFGAHCRAGEGSADRGGPGLDAGDRGNGDGPGLPDDRARQPTPATLSAFLDSQKEHVKGKIVLVGKSIVVPVNFNPPAKRRRRCAGARPVRSGQSQRRPGWTRRRRPRRPQAQPAMSAVELTLQVNARFLIANGAKVTSTTPAASTGRSSPRAAIACDVSKVPPTVVMRNENYGRISRILADGTPVELEFNIVSKRVLGRTDRVA